MTTADVWAIALAVIAAVAPTASVVLWFVDRHRQSRDTPMADIHLELEPWRPTLQTEQDRN